MKFIHTGDLHLNSKILGLPSDKSKIRREEILRTFEKICDYAVKEGVAAVILAGDIFDTDKVSVKLKERFLSAIECAKGVDFLLLWGNHDGGNILGENLPDNLKLFSEEWTSLRYGDVLISGVNFDGKNNSFIYDSLKLDKNDVNIVVLHGQTAAYNAKDADFINLPKLKDKNIDYLALGHIHSYQKERLDDRGVYAYCGCPDGRGFDELGEKGFLLLDEKDKKIESRFIKTSSREFCEMVFDLSGENSFSALKADVIDLARKTYAETSLLKLILKGEREVDFLIDADALTSLLNEYFFFAKVYDKTSLKINREDFALDRSVKGEFIRAVLNSDLSEEIKDKIIVCGLNALKGEEII